MTRLKKLKINKKIFLNQFYSHVFILRKKLILGFTGLAQFEINFQNH